MHKRQASTTVYWPNPLPIFPWEAYNLIDNLLFLLADGDKEQKMNTVNFQGQMIQKSVWLIFGRRTASGLEI